MASSNPLSRIQHIVVLMLENRSFDSMLGFLYADQGNKSPSGQPFEGLTGKEANLDSTGKSIPVFKIEPTNKNAYFMPGTDPGEGYAATNSQLFGSVNAPIATNQGFVKDFSSTSGGRKRRQAGQSKSCRERSIRISWASSPLRCCPCFQPSRVATPCAITGIVPDRDHAEPRVRLRSYQSGPHGRQDQILHRAQHFRPAWSEQCELDHLWLRYGPAHTPYFPRHQQRGRLAFRPLQRFPGRSRWWNTSGLHVSGA